MKVIIYNKPATSNYGVCIEDNDFFMDSVEKPYSPDYDYFGFCEGGRIDMWVSKNEEGTTLASDRLSHINYILVPLNTNQYLEVISSLIASDVGVVGKRNDQYLHLIELLKSYLISILV